MRRDRLGETFLAIDRRRSAGRALQLGARHAHVVWPLKLNVYRPSRRHGSLKLLAWAVDADKRCGR